MSEYTPEETKRHRAEWVAALRSGEFPQTHGVLRSDKGYCCLGVASEVCARAGVGGYQLVTIGTKPFAWEQHIYNGETTQLTSAVAEWLGLKSDDHEGRLSESVEYLNHEGGTSRANTLMALNDCAGYTFDQIADVIESGNLVLAEGH